MAEYIDREETLKIIESYSSACTEEGKVVAEAIKDIITVITPTADVVEVVRCKDCKYCVHGYPVKAIGEEALEGWYCRPRKRYMRSDDYCSYGKRKEEK